jgi:hypothetical protein
MLKIKKLTPRMWAGAGFGTKAASYGVENRPDIRIIREAHGWTAYIGTRKLFGTTKAELETQLT